MTALEKKKKGKGLIGRLAGCLNWDVSTSQLTDFLNSQPSRLQLSFQSSLLINQTRDVVLRNIDSKRPWGQSDNKNEGGP